MKQWPEFCITVGELAFSMHMALDIVKEAAGTNSASTRLTGAHLDSTLERLKSKFAFQSKSWDLSLLDGFQGDWVDSLRKLYSTPVAYPASIPPSQGIQIRELILRESPESVLEIGCFIGISSHWIASALNENGKGFLDSIDTFWPKYPLRFHFSYLFDPFSLAINTASQTNVGKRITFHHSDSIAFSNRLAPNCMYDFIFIDGDHTFEGVSRDFLALFAHLRRGGIILLHDTNPEYCGWDGPRRFIDKVLKKNLNISVEEIKTEPNFGIAIVRKLTEQPLILSKQQTIEIFMKQTIYEASKKLKNLAPSKFLIREFIKPLAAKVGRH